MPVELARPAFLYLLLLLPLWWRLVWPRAAGGVLFPHAGAHAARAGGGPVPGAILLVLPRILRVGALACLVVALAHPQRIEVVREPALRGKAMAIAVDISTSMLASDMEDGSTRMSVAREAAVRFAESRDLDELSLVAFAGQAVRRVPPTTDSDVIATGIETLDVQLVLDGTDISAAMLTSMASLIESDRDERVIVLLTDGAHNGTGVTPLTTARGAAALGMRVHSIALLGEPDLASAPPTVRAAILARQSLVESEMQTVLSAIAGITGGEYFRASNEAALDSIYQAIAEIEAPREEMEEREVPRSLRAWPLLAALLLIGLEAGLRGTRWGLLP
jgi:Ca-activated chloride channel family protein